MRYKDIAKELSVDPGTVTRDIQFLQKRSYDYIDELVKGTMPFLFEKSLAGINEVLGECWRIYHSPDENLNWFHRLGALKLAKECSEEIYSLTKNGPWVMGARRIMVEFESIKRESGIANQLGNEHCHDKTKYKINKLHFVKLTWRIQLIST